MYDNECLKNVNLISWSVEIGFILVPAIALFFGLLFLKKKLKDTKYDLSTLLKAENNRRLLFKIKLMAAICVILVVPPVLYIKVKLVDPIFLEMARECWVSIPLK